METITDISVVQSESMLRGEITQDDLRMQPNPFPQRPESQDKVSNSHDYSSRLQVNPSVASGLHDGVKKSEKTIESNKQMQTQLHSE